mgnify:CR=1 FL=1
MKFIKRLFCNHKYNLIEHADIYDFYDYKHKLPIGQRYVFMCEKCGRVKKVKTY